MLREDPARNPSAWRRVEAQRKRNEQDQWQLHGELRAFDVNNTLRVIAHYRNNKTDGVMQTFFPSGKQHESRSYHQGMPHGVFEEWYESGALKRRCEYRECKQVGTLQWFYESGHLQREAHFDEHGHDEGAMIGWFENGREHYRTTYLNDRAIHSIEFNEDGSIRSMNVQINEGHLYVSRPGTPKQRVFMIGNEDDFERPIALPVDDVADR